MIKSNLRQVDRALRSGVLPGQRHAGIDLAKRLPPAGFRFNRCIP
jgi:hypothetical protein